MMVTMGGRRNARWARRRVRRGDAAVAARRVCPLPLAVPVVRAPGVDLPALARGDSPRTRAVHMLPPAPASSTRRRSILSSPLHAPGGTGTRSVSATAIAAACTSACTEYYAPASPSPTAATYRHEQKERHLIPAAPILRSRWSSSTLSSVHSAHAHARSPASRSQGRYLKSPSSSLALASTSMTPKTPKSASATYAKAKAKPRPMAARVTATARVTSSPRGASA
ncbi:hypothetical protein K438DRAFT_4252 [Mycena galopus ATCC 62051]|nr:hypothetical protein K438DRAFT_4252 [Mycena galopus ATCC 62051]